MVTDAMVEAAARAAYAYHSESARGEDGVIRPVEWDALPRPVKHMRRKVARVHLEGRGDCEG